MAEHPNKAPDNLLESILTPSDETFSRLQKQVSASSEQLMQMMQKLDDDAQAKS